MLNLINYRCKDQIGLEPRTEMDLGPKSPNNKFVESGRKSQSEFRIKILVYSVKRKELYAYIYRKYPRTCPSTMTESTKFFLFAVVFLQPLCSFSFFFFSLVFFLCPLLFLFLRIIYYGFYTISSIHVWVRCWKSFFSILSYLFLNLPFLAVRLRVHCSGITSTLMRSESQLGSI